MCGSEKIPKIVAGSGAGSRYPSCEGTSGQGSAYRLGRGIPLAHSPRLRCHGQDRPVGIRPTRPTARHGRSRVARGSS